MSIANALNLPLGSTTWVPTLAFNSDTTGITYSLQVGKYSIFGEYCYVTILLNTTSIGSTTGAATITNLPFQALNENGIITAAHANVSLDGGYTYFVGGTTANTTILQVYECGASGLQVLTNSNMLDGSRLNFSGFYRIA